MPESPHVSPPPSVVPRGSKFEATRWSVVLRARDEDSGQRQRALGELWGAYWYPLYAFLRSSGRSREDAEDLLQEFFARLLDGRLLHSANPGRGKFRMLLLATLKNLDADAWRAARSQKRGGGMEMLPLETVLAEERWLVDSSRGASPEAAFDRAWAIELMQRASSRLKAAVQDSARGALHQALLPWLSGSNHEYLADVAERFGMTEGAVKMALLRLRQRFAEALRLEVAETVGTRDEVANELRYLLASFS